ncbi:flagellar hook-associated protein FlgK [Candidatus Methylospira mobilis]|uniref:Flagellar hook-associated protein 1 n=1 Tax=Candidatus Methylospira mobilis TaxID=1808979 RepID=A0A5Q0BJR1_9GAMM|nr:flagellar hook-associated protein FlgK [Candidatus Methylospira mobilis]QFY42441.1 flagellar hook-associated protein FlgK [Candidatus Methylospira mobilis]
MGWDTLNIGLSGLQAAQIGLNVTGNNITNASTPGYSRQQITQAGASTALYSGVYGTLQMGVDVTGVQRVYSAALGAQVRQTQAASSGVSIYSTQVQNLDSVLANTTGGVASALTKFGSTLQSLAASPSNTGVRQAAMSAAQALVNSFQSANTQLSQINSGVNSQIQDSVNTINTLATQIAQVNSAIAQVAGSGASNTPNSLMDQRDQLLQTLSEQVGVTVNTEADGSMVDITIGNGVPLVTGTQATPLNVSYANSPSLAGQTQAVVQFQTATGGTQTIVDGAIGSGGTLGGLLQFRNASLNQAQTAMGQMATQIANSFNAQNALGLDANSAQGAAIFSVSGNSLQLATSDSSKLAAAAPIVTASSGGAMYNAAIEGVSGVTASATSVQAALTAVQAQVTTPSAGNITNATTAVAAAVTAANTALTNVTAAAAASPPTATAADVTAATAANTAVLAMSTAINAATAVPATGTWAQALTAAQTAATAANASTNTGSGAISAGSVSTGYFNSAIPTTVPPSTLKLTFTSATTYTVSGSPTASDNTGGPYTYTPGAPVSLNGGTISFTISGAPNSGDSFNVTQNLNGIADGRNATLLQNMQSYAPATAVGVSTTSAAAAIAANGAGVDPTYTGTPLQAGQSIKLTYNASGGFDVTDPYGNTTANAVTSYTSGSVIRVDGLSFSITGGPVAGDTFTVTASGIQAQAAAANTGGASVAVNGSGIDPTYTGVPLQAGQAVQLVYNSATSSFTATGPDGNQSIIAYTSGSPITVDGLSFTITGAGAAAPKTGDTFTVAPNVISGNSYSGGYSALVNLIGNTTSVMASNNTAQSALLSSAQTAQQSQSGVNLDEEAAHLIQYQQAYQASAKVITIAQQMLDTLLAIPA